MVWPQIPRTDAPHTAATAALASLAYRDGAVSDLTDTDESTNHKAGRTGLFSPTLGEAFSRAVIKRTLNAGRKPLVPSFGTDARLVVEHCVAAGSLRRERDKRLTAVAFIAGFLFLPGTLLWLAAFEVRRRSAPERRSVYGGAALAVAVLLTVLFAWRPFAHGYAGLYVRVMMLVPVAGWFVAQRFCLRAAEQLRERWNAVLDGSGVGPIVRDAVPIGPADARAEQLRKSLEALVEEQDTNVVHYAGAKGILGMGRRWGAWQLAEQLDPREGVDEIRPFHPWDVVRKIEDNLKQMSRSSMADSGIPQMSVNHWVVQAIPEGADEISRPFGADRMDGTRMRTSAITELANRQTFGNGPRHYLGAQFVLWEGQLVVTLLTNVTLLHQTLRVEVTGYAIGPMATMFDKKAKPKEKSVAKTGKPWEERTVHLPIMTPDEVVRLTVRAPFTWPWGQPILDWLGGTLKLPEPFGLRSAWANKPWTHRFMADDALRVATPVLRAVHQATMQVLADHDVDVDRFKNRSQMLGSEVQGVRPTKVDEYDM
ncbi:hypothetical protein ACEZCY_00460 [Streptacidiphilus sp. N1-12]|uniref:Uncharacterized protein n=2 Tax=Streptacidiphilus alkalitolerans TaxID=3342712 RepID=A0ABV6W6M3_9ACTN